MPKLNRASRKIRVGKVISNKMDQTVVVAIEWRQRHPIYKKSVKHITKLMAQDDNNLCNIGDIVNVMETRPLSKTKRWRVTSVLNSNVLEQPQAGQTDQTTIMNEPNNETTDTEITEKDVTDPDVTDTEEAS